MNSKDRMFAGIYSAVVHLYVIAMEEIRSMRFLACHCGHNTQKVLLVKIVNM